MFAPTTWRDRLLAVVALAAIAAFYTITAAGNLSETDDAFAFAYRVEHFPLTHANDPRLIGYHALARGVWLLAQALAIDLRGLEILRAISVLGATACLWLVARILMRNLRVAPAPALLATLCLGGSYGFWRYAAEGDVYAPAMMCCAWILHCLLERDSGWRRGALIGACAGAAVLFYQPNVIPLFLVFPLLLLASGAPVLLAYGAAGAATAAAGYLAGFLVYWPEPLGVHAIATFMVQRSEEFLIPPLSLRTVAVSMIKSALTLGHDIVSANWVFGLPRAEPLVQRLFSGHVIAEELFLARSAGALVYVPLAILPALAVAAWRVASAARPYLLATQSVRPMPLIWYWTLLVGAINGRLNPAGVEAWIVILLPLTLLIAVNVIAPAWERRSVAACMLLALLVAHNTVGGMLLVRSPASDLTYVRGEWVIKNAKVGDLVIVSGNANLAEALRYRSRAQVLNVHPFDAAGLPLALVAQDGPIFQIVSQGRDFAGIDVVAVVRRIAADGGRVVVFDGFFTLPESAAAQTAAQQLKLASTLVHRDAAGGATWVLRPVWAQAPVRQDSRSDSRRPPAPGATGDR